MKKRNLNAGLLLLAIILFSTIVFAQEIGQQRGPQFVSPEVSAENKVTFKVLSKDANSIKINGSWMGWGETADLKKGADDIWSVTIGPLESTMYHYNFWFLTAQSLCF